LVLHVLVPADLYRWLVLSTAPLWGSFYNIMTSIASPELSEHQVSYQTFTRLHFSVAPFLQVQQFQNGGPQSPRNPRLHDLHRQNGRRTHRSRKAQHLGRRQQEKLCVLRSPFKPPESTYTNTTPAVDLVTETDRAVESLISTSLRAQYPNFSFMGEETYQPGDTLTSAPTFICDPIDGTTNFVHRYPYVSISLGFAVNLEPTIGIVYNPFTDTLYSAIKGKGAWLNQKLRLPLSEPTPLESLNTCLVAVEWGSDRSGNDFKVKSETFKRLAATKENGGGMVHGLRSFGSAALNLCGVASGGLDIYWEAGCWAWDVCAGWVILTESGGKMVDANPGNWSPRIDERRYFAVRGGEGQKEVIEEFWSLVDGAFEVGV
jgi:myo-inositol-1(or 4)-monophosphatase